MRLITAILIASCFAAQSNADDKKKPGKPPSAADEIAKKSAPAIVSIDCLNQERQTIATTSGFLVSENGRILTDLSPLVPCTSLNVRLANGDVHDSVFYIDADARKDVVVLRIKTASLPFLRLADSNESDVDQVVFTPERGVVNGARQMDGYKLLQLSASPALKPGTPVLDEHGAVIGMTAAKKPDGAGSMAFALPINYARGYLDSTTEFPFPRIAEAMRKQQSGNMAPPAGRSNSTPGVILGGIIGSIPSTAPPPPPPPPTKGDFSSSPQRIKIGGQVQQANLIKRVAPVYPPLAKQAQISGVVHLNAVIAKDGTIIELHVLGGAHPLLVPAAIEAVKQWVYKPTLLNGEPVEVATTIDVNFVAGGGNPPEVLATAPFEGAPAGTPIEISSDKMEIVLRGGIGIWDLAAAKVVLGDAAAKGPFDAPGGLTSYEFPQTGNRYRTALLRFSGEGKLVNAALAPAQNIPWGRQLAYMRQKFPGNEPASVPAGSATSYEFAHSRTNFVVRDDGTVAYVVVY